MATSKKAPIKKAKPPTIQLADAELRAELDRVADFLGEDAPALLRRIIRRGLLAEYAVSVGADHEDARRNAAKIRYDHIHISTYISDVLGVVQSVQQPAEPQPVAGGNIVFDSFGDTEDV